MVSWWNGWVVNAGLAGLAVIIGGEAGGAGLETGD